MTGSGRQEPASGRIRWSGENDEAAVQTAMTAVSREDARRCRLLAVRGRPNPVTRRLNFDVRNQSFKILQPSARSRTRRFLATWPRQAEWFERRPPFWARVRTAG